MGIISDILGNGIPANLAGALPASVINKSKMSSKPGKLCFPPSDVANMKYGMQFKFVKQSYEKYGQKAQFTRKIEGAHIFLPMPTSVMESLQHNYNVSDLGAAGTLFEAGGQMMDQILASASGTQSEADKSKMVSDAVSAALNVSGYVARRLIGGISQETGQAIDLKLGNVVNPYTVAVYTSTAPRTHTFCFRLIPRTEEDSKMIRTIVDTFKYHSLASRSGGDSSTGGIFLKMPEELEVCFFGTEFLFKFARCVVQNVQVNYTPLGSVSMFAGTSAPVAAELTLSLQEIEMLTKESYGDEHLQLAQT